jgi:uncharacterized integral membrane protein (TIGR00697 family)
MTTKHDRWLLPSRQREYPSRRVLSEGQLHARREATFLWLAGCFLMAVAVLPVLGMTRVLDLSGLLPDVELPVALLVPAGVLAFPLSFTAACLVCELWGRRRASAMVVVGTVLDLALLGLLAATDRIADASGQLGDSVAPGLALVAGSFVGHMFNVQAYHALRRQSRGRHLWLRRNVAALLALVSGWVVFALVLYTYAIQVAEQPSDDAARQVAALAAGGGVYTFVGALVDTVPLLLAARALVVFLRVGSADGDREDYAEGPTAGLAEPAPRRPAALVVETPAPVPPAPPPPPPAAGDSGSDKPRPGRISKAFSTVERRFFTEGDEMESSEMDADQSGDNLSARGGQSA